MADIVYSDLNVEDIVSRLGLKPHPEGGYFKETFRDASTNNTGRSVSTMIFYLLKAGQCSRLHRIDASEGWHHYAGGPLNVVELDQSGPVITKLGMGLISGEIPQHVVHAGHWFGAIPAEGTQWTLVGCTVAPAFEFENFELGERDKLMKEFGTTCKDWIEKLTPES